MMDAVMTEDREEVIVAKATAVMAEDEAQVTARITPHDQQNAELS
jgi:hypothetical protein